MVPIRYWYHFGMAMTVRLPADLDRALNRIAEEEHVSKHSLLLRGAELIIARRSRIDQVDAAVDFVLAHDAELMSRLEDA